GRPQHLPALADRAAGAGPAGGRPGDDRAAELRLQGEGLCPAQEHRPDRAWPDRAAAAVAPVRRHAGTGAGHAALAERADADDARLPIRYAADDVAEWLAVHLVFLLPAEVPRLVQCDYTERSR